MSDLISRKALIEALEKEEKIYKDNQTYPSFYTAKAVTRHQPPAQQWIPCSERLPEDRKEKLVYLSSDRITVAVYNEHRLPHSGDAIGWGYPVPYGYIDFEKEYPIAWMPLPEAYKGE